jgi:signal transduction histidine kinase
MSQAIGAACLLIAAMNAVIALVVVPLTRRVTANATSLVAAGAIAAVLFGNAAGQGLLGVHLMDGDGVSLDGRVASQAIQFVGSAVFMVVLWRAELRLRRLRRVDRSHDAAAAAEKLDTVGIVTSGAAHDFGNVLALVNAFAAFAERDLARGDAAAAADGIRQLKDAAASGVQLTENLIAFNGPLPFDAEPIAVNGVLAGLPALLDGVAKDMTLDLALEPALPPILAGRSLIERSVLNLVKNSAEAGATRVEISTRAETGVVRLDVVDDGAGMTDEVRARALDPFFTTKPRGAGNGLGLASVQSLVARAGGTLRISSAPGIGTTVSLMFPVAAPASAPAARWVRRRGRAAEHTVDAAA